MNDLEEIEDILKSYFNQDIVSVEVAIEEFLDENELDYKIEITKRLERLLDSTVSGEELPNFIKINTSISFTKLGKEPVEWLQYFRQSIVENIQTSDFYVDLFKRAMGIGENFIGENADNIEEKIVNAVALITGNREFNIIDKNRLIAQLRNIAPEKPDQVAMIINNKNEPTPWFNSRYDQISWKYWRRYRKYLLEVKKRNNQFVDSLDSSTEQIIKRLEDPEGARPFDIKGLVVGHVQSGKTANYTALICKALDAGYRLVIVLAGLHDDLRTQTQIRLDEEVLGYDQFSKKVGVGHFEELPLYCLTSREEGGDVSSNLLSRISVYPSINNPLLLVVKKNKYLLQAVIEYFRHRGNDQPLLLIDDEADQASIDTVKYEDSIVDEEQDPSTINRLIRELLMKFPKKAYVGYTATPFANVLIDHEADHSVYGPDLFPKDFVATLSVPKNYMGPTEVFGISEASKGLPIIREVRDEFNFALDDEGYPSQIPNSLVNSMRSFVLSTTCRALRGQGNEHNSMLIHVKRSVDYQRELSTLVKEQLDRIAIALKYDDRPEREIELQKLNSLWISDFMPTSETMYGQVSEKWDDIVREINKTIARITIQIINGESNDSLNYKDNTEKGLFVIVIGGDKLSRGLTLDGLTTSYYLRSSNMYDTLMQMGRWFGYREGYEDLCRVYSTPDLIESYRHVALATENLRKDLKLMQAWGLTPVQFGLRVMSHPSLQVTNAMKLRTGVTINETLSYSGTTSQTVLFEASDKIIENNYVLTEEFITSTSSSILPSVSGNYIWETDHSNVVKFLKNFITPENAITAKSDLWARYIIEQVDHGELTNWTVALMSNIHRNEYSFNFSNNKHCNPVLRQYLIREHDSVSIGALTSQGDEFIDVDLEGMDKMKAEAKRKLRDSKNGLLLIYPLVITNRYETDGKKLPLSGFKQQIFGLAAAFPFSPTAKSIDFVANKIYIKNNREN